MSWFFNLQDTLFSFLEKGGGVVLLISLLVVLMWFFIFERIWYFSLVHPLVEKETIQEWSKVPEHKSWKGHMIRSMLVSKANLQIRNNLELIRVCVAIAPLFGLLGTIVGMIEVFHILAVTGGGDAKAMAGGVARSTIPAMAGLMAAIPASIAARWLENNAKKKSDLLSERLTYE
jgi:biopolymer transport protein ExbB